MTLFVICAVGVALVGAVAVLLLIRFARRRSEQGAPVPHNIAPSTSPSAAARTPAPSTSTPARPPTPAASTPAPAAPARPTSWEDEPYGTGSAHPLPDGSAPSSEYTVKGDPDEMRYLTIDSQDFGRVRAEVWFRTERDAQKAGFTKSQG